HEPQSGVRPLRRAAPAVARSPRREERLGGERQLGPVGEQRKTDHDPSAAAAGLVVGRRLCRGGVLVELHLLHRLIYPHLRPVRSRGRTGFGPPMRKPKIKDCYRVERLEGEALVLLAEDDYAIFTGAIYEEVGPLITGVLDEEAIVRTLSGTLRPEEVYYALLQLELKGYLCDAAEPAPPPMESAYWQLSGVAAGAMQDLGRCSVYE